MLVFVYGTLKRGLRLHYHIADQQFMGEANTEPLYELFNCGWYPGLVECRDGISIAGEIWEVDDAGLTILDEVEGVDEQLFARRRVALLEPFDQREVFAYFYLQDVSNFEKCGPSWPPP
jgi:gamma-glutamylcyclotransferase (GGCT)/AIG2-like uncharacterized protein YtfP